MKKFVNEILKPTSIFAVYIFIVAFISTIIGKFLHTDTTIVMGIIFLVTYPIYLYFMD